MTKVNQDEIDEAIALMQQTYALLTEDAFEWVTADIVKIGKPGIDEVANTPIQNITVKYNGEERKIALSGAPVIKQSLKTVNKEDRTIQVPWSSTDPRRYKESNGTYWAYS